MALFEFTGSNPSNPAHYSLASGSPCGIVTEQMCTLEAAKDANDKPVITNALKDEMINSLQNQVNGPNVSLKSR
ncbi:hypothetical protein ACFX5U_08710 [Sphingobacterium sp. SG20118]|uniref:hypothetical protein n=1 Tax=Sphingobacterium sp. SG20118 TaxID=3367156 RepID=UPI0037DFC507